MIGCEIIGIEGLRQDLNAYSKESQKAIDKAVKQTATQIESVAKKRLMGMMGSDKHTIHGGAGLLGSIYNRMIESMEWVVGTPNFYAPYIEFGTGDLVFTNFDFEDEAKKVASQFKGKGIRKVNIKGDSFLNFAAVNQSKKLVERIETELNKINR
jgi:hypothetical protein